MENSLRFQRDSKPAGYYIVPALGGPERKMADAGVSYLSGGGLSWSPDGRYLAVADRAPGSQAGEAVTLSYISVASGERRNSNIELPGPFVQAPIFSPDGKYLAFISGAGFLSADVYVTLLSVVANRGCSPQCTRSCAQLPGQLTVESWCSIQHKWVIHAVASSLHRG